MRTYKGLIEDLPENGVFVFGSNIQGRHGAGTARIAYDRYGAIYGDGFGHHGQSYAIATVDMARSNRPSVSSLFVIDQIVDFYEYADHKKNLDFFVAYTTKGPFLSGFTLDELVSMFKAAASLYGLIPDNVIFEEQFAEALFG